MHLEISETNPMPAGLCLCEPEYDFDDCEYDGGDRRAAHSTQAGQRIAGRPNPFAVPPRWPGGRPQAAPRAEGRGCGKTRLGLPADRGLRRRRAGTESAVMTPNVVCCSPDDDIAVAIEVMEAKQIRRLPVTDSHKMMIGMLSLGDISRKVSKKMSGEVLFAVSGHHV